MNKRNFLAHLLAILAAVLSYSTAGWAADADRPNIVLFLADDLGCGDLGCYGCADINTPNIDNLARQGVRFTQFYANGPECTPTRTALLTGRYQQRVGGLECAIGTGNVGRYDDAIRLRASDDLGLPPDASSLPRLLRAAGYATGICGKWHLGYNDRFSPNRHGFDYAFYCLGGGMDYFHYVEDVADYPSVLRINGKPLQRSGYFTDLVADEAVQFIAAHRREPFFLYVPFTAPHAPYQGPGDYRPEPLPLDSPLWNQSKGPPAVYAAMVQRMDEAVGKILAALRGNSPESPTLVILTSDNGPTASARPTAFRGLKGTTFEGGIRVPCIVRWPGVLPENTVTDQVAITMDLTASLAHVVGASAPTGRPFDGVDILTPLAARQPPSPRTMYWRGRRGQNTWWAVRDGDLKFVAHRSGEKKQEYLFDLHEDVGERNDLLGRRKTDAERLQHLLAEWEKDVRPQR
jgi:arylsulfatase A-like enzyme